MTLFGTEGNGNLNYNTSQTINYEFRDIFRLTKFAWIEDWKIVYRFCSKRVNFKFRSTQEILDSKCFDLLHRYTTCLAMCTQIKLLRRREQICTM
jgi:hypothetical protein